MDARSRFWLREFEAAQNRFLAAWTAFNAAVSPEEVEEANAALSASWQLLEYVMARAHREGVRLRLLPEAGIAIWRLRPARSA